MLSSRLATASRARAFALAAVAVVGTFAGLGCLATGANGNTEYYPDETAYRDAVAAYDANPIAQRGGSHWIWGHGPNATSYDLAKRIARSNAAEIAARQIVFPRVRMEDPEAADYFEQSKVFETQAELFKVFDVALEPVFAKTIVNPELSVYDTYWNVELTEADLAALIDGIIGWYTKTFRGGAPRDLTLGVVVSDLQMFSNIEEREQIVLDAMRTARDRLRYRGEFSPMADDGRYSEAQERAMREFVFENLADGSRVEIHFTLVVPYNKRLRELRLYDPRGRQLDPMPVVEHPQPTGGRYRYVFEIESLIVGKGQPTVPVDVVDEAGAGFHLDYALYDQFGVPQFAYTDKNLAMFSLVQFQGELNRFIETLNQELRYTDPETGEVRRVQIQLADTLVLGGATTSSERGDARFTYQISIRRTNAERVFYSFQEPAGTSRDTLDGLPWQVIWEHRDPDRRWGELNAIRIPDPADGESDKRVYVKVEYNAGRDYDVMLFDWTGRDRDEPLRDAAVLFSTRSPG